MTRIPIPTNFGLWLAGLAVCLFLGACGDSEEAAYRNGWNAGYEQGRTDGRSEGRLQAEAGHQGKWGLLGLAIGGVVGAAVVAFVTRSYLATRWRRWRQRLEIERLVGSCPVALDEELHAEVREIARKKAALEERLEQDDGPLIATLHDRLRPELTRLDTRLLDIAALLQQLRDLRRETVSDVATRKRPRKPVTAGDSEESDALSELEERRRIEVEKNAENIARCETQLAGLATFLDELKMRLGNLKTIEQVDAFDRFEKDIGVEIDALGATFEKTLESLSRVA